jgi:transcriptional regulator of acetoin/glycerol metabolism
LHKDTGRPYVWTTPLGLDDVTLEHLELLPDDIAGRIEEALMAVNAQKEGRYKGRPKSASLRASEARRMVADGRTVTEAAKALGIARASVYRALEAA